MEFFKRLLINLAGLAAIGLFQLIAFLDVMKQVFQIYGALFGPVATLLLNAISLPRRGRGRRMR